MGLIRLLANGLEHRVETAKEATTFRTEASEGRYERAEPTSEVEAACD